MILIVGLGNPGEKYSKTRHNVGFMVLDALADNLGIDFKEDKKRNALTAEYTMIFEGQKKKTRLVLVKPLTFMNNSGEAVQKIRKYYQIPEENIWVIHDDLDIDLGLIRIRKGGSSAGQKGIQSIIDSLGGYNEFIRFRIGIRPDDGQKGSAEDFVLKKFIKAEQKIVDGEIIDLVETIKKACDCGIEPTTI
jgi:PTH1 family peptidyl-tRNA hydrolase